MNVLRTLAQISDAHLSSLVFKAVKHYFPGTTDGSHSTMTDCQSRWFNTIVDLSRRCAIAVDQNVKAGDRSDIRLYVKIKAIPDAPEDVEALLASSNRSTMVHTPHVISVSEMDGMIEEPLALPRMHMDGKVDVDASKLTSSVGRQEIVNGVVFRKSLPHKSMRSDFVSPRIIIIDGKNCSHSSAVGISKLYDILCNTFCRCNQL